MSSLSHKANTPRLVRKELTLEINCDEAHDYYAHERMAIQTYSVRMLIGLVPILFHGECCDKAHPQTPKQRSPQPPNAECKNL